MAYIIIPPILIVLSLAGIVYFLMKKAPQMAELAKKEEEAKQKEADDLMERRGFIRRTTARVRGINWAGMKNSILSFMEKIMRRLRLIFLKLENSFRKMSEWIRTRRSRTQEKIEDKIEEKKEEERKIEARRIEIIMPTDSILKEEEKIIRPIISDKVVSPHSRTEMKDRLEDLLIDRIAVDPRDVEAYERLAEYYFEVGNYSDAKECYKQVIKLDPKNRNVRYKMRRLERIIGM